ncbi:MAG: hypothetical protein M1831_006041 [Alyxoria varia]|nr:MAG: hypothetical protein M1831_006041 [Alyxoria varia]
MAPRGKPFSKKTSTTYALVSRPQHDPRIHDTDAPSQVFTEVAGPSTRSTHESTGSRKVKHRGDLEEEFGLSGLIRKNEGEAAEHGIYYDDSSYDYMQHLKDLGGEGAEVTWVEAPVKDKKGKGKQKLEDALRGVKLEDEDEKDGSVTEGAAPGQRLDEAQIDGHLKAPSYQDQQAVPDALQGFQPGMDPRLREVLEALDDEAFVDEEDDIFAELAKDGGEEMDPESWEADGEFFEDDENGWESDETTKPNRPLELDDGEPTSILNQLSSNTGDEGSGPTTDGEWFANFAKSKAGLADSAIDSKRPKPAPSISPSQAQSMAISAIDRKRKKRKGALTSSAGFSMTSSAIARTEALSTLDARFDRVADSYMDDINEGEEFFDDDDAASVMTGASRMSRASRWGGTSSAGGGVPQTNLGINGNAPSQMSIASEGFGNVMSDFLSGPSGGPKGRRMKKGGKPGEWGTQSGLSQLDEIRGSLGPPRFNSNKESAGASATTQQRTRVRA